MFCDFFCRLRTTFKQILLGTLSEWKLFGSRWRATFCWSLSGSKLFAKVICSQQKLLLACKGLNTKKATLNQLGDNCIQNFNLGRHIVGYTGGNLVFQRRASGAVKRDFQMFIQRYTSPNENFEYSYFHSNALLQLHIELERCKPHKAARHPTKCDINNDVKLFQTV